MAVELEFLLQLDEAENATARFQDEFITNIYAAAARGEEGMREFAGKSREELEKLANAAQKAAQRQAAEQEKASKAAASAAEQAAKEAIRAAEKQAEEQARLAKETAAAAKDAAKEKARAEAEAQRAVDELARAVQDQKKKWADNANEVRGIVGDIGDAVGQLGKGFLGLSETQQLVADKMIYMTEKGMALGSSIGMLVGGPLGALAGSAIGAVGGGIMGYLAGNTEAAAIEMSRQIEVAIEADRVNRELSTTIKDLNKAMGATDTTTLSGTIKNYDAVTEKLEDLRKEQEKLGIELDNNRKRTSLDIEETEEQKEERDKLIVSLAATGKAIKELEKIQETASLNLKARAKEEGQISANSQAQLKDLTKEQLTSVVASSKAAFEIAKLKQGIAAKGLEDQKTAEDTAKLSKKIAENAAEVARTKKEYEAAEKALKAFGKTAAADGKKAAEASIKSLQIVRDHADSIMDDGRGGLGYATEDMEDEAARLAAFQAKIAANEAATLRAHNAVKEQELQRYQEAVSNAEQDASLRALEARERQQAEELAALERHAAMINAAIAGIGQTFAQALGGVATEAFNDWLETLATGEKDAEKSFRKMAAAMVRSIGEQLVADGIKNIFMGAAEAIAGRKKTGLALIAIGSGEVAAGIGMGAAGARAQRRQGYGDEPDNGSLGRNSNTRGNGTIVQAPTIIQIQSLTPGDKRAWQEAGRVIEQARGEYHKG